MSSLRDIRILSSSWSFFISEVDNFVREDEDSQHANLARGFL